MSDKELDAIIRRMPVASPDYPKSPQLPIIRVDMIEVDQTPMSIGEIIQTLRVVNPWQAYSVRLPFDVIEYITPFHAACMKASTRYEKRAAWREWSKAIDKLHKSMRVSALEAN